MSDQTDATILSSARRLREARLERVAIDPIRDVLGDDIDAAYGVHEHLLGFEFDEGRRITGREIGLTSEAVQRQLGVEQPLIGVLLDSIAVPNDANVDIGSLIQPRVEAEFAVVLASDLTADDLSPDHIHAAVAEVCLSLEIVDSRIGGWDIGIQNTVADNTSSALYVLGEAPRPLNDLDLRPVAVRPGSTYSATAAGFGPVRVAFTTFQEHS
jgi:2-keto-4-pentenoate hydratase